MKSINEINGYIYGFDNQKLFKGKLLLDADGWIEGIISPNDDSNDEKQFVFGFFYPEKVIELFGLSLMNNYTALNFHTEKCADYYNGEVLIVNEDKQQPYGLCNMVIQKPKLDSEDTLCESGKLEYQIEEFKKNMDLYATTFYNEAIQNKARIIKVVVDTYNVNADIKKLLK